MASASCRPGVVPRPFVDNPRESIGRDLQAGHATHLLAKPNLDSALESSGFMNLLKPYYLLADANGHSLRGSQIHSGHFIQSRHEGGDLVSRNTWECMSTPQLAVMVNPLHAQSVPARLFEIRHREVALVPRRAGVNLYIRELSVPTVAPIQKLAFAIMAVRDLNYDHPFTDWAQRWLAGTDRTTIAARLALASLNKVAAMQHAGGVDPAEFARRGQDVLSAALLWARKPVGWEQGLPDYVAAAVSGLPDTAVLAHFARVSLSMNLEPETKGTAVAGERRYAIIRQQDRRSEKSPRLALVQPDRLLGKPQPESSLREK